MNRGVLVLWETHDDLAKNSQRALDQGQGEEVSLSSYAVVRATMNRALHELLEGAGYVAEFLAYLSVFRP